MLSGVFSLLKSLRIWGNQVFMTLSSFLLHSKTSLFCRLLQSMGPKTLCQQEKYQIYNTLQKKKQIYYAVSLFFFLIVFIFLPVLWKINKDQRGKCCNANFQNSLHYRFNDVQLLFNPASGFQKAIKPWLGKLNNSTKDESQMISTKRLFECF